MKTRIILASLMIIIQMAFITTAQSDLSNISGTWDIIANGFHGTMALDSNGNTIQFEAGLEKLTDISFDGKNIKFYRNSNYGSDYSQLYTGEMSGDTMEGTFTQQNLAGGIFQWSAKRANGPQVQPTENHPPTVTLDYSPEYPTDADAITLKADAEDPDGDQLVYSWFIGKTEIGYETGTELRRQLAPGDYEYTVKVSDGKGGIAEATVRFTVIKKTPPPPCNGLLLDLEEGPGSVVIAKVVDDCEHNPLSNADLDIVIFHVYDKQLDKYINGEVVNRLQNLTDGNGEAIIPVNGNPGDMYRVDVYASKDEWDTSDSSIHITIGG